MYILFSMYLIIEGKDEENVFYTGITDEYLNYGIIFTILLWLSISVLWFLTVVLPMAIRNFFSEPEQKSDIAFITKNEEYLLEAYRKLNPVQQKSILQEINAL